MFKFLPTLFLLLTCTSCAYMINSKLVKVPITTNPSGATVTINNETFTTPAVVKLPRGEGNFNLHIEKPGYEPIDIQLTESFDIWFFANIPFGPVGLAVDFTTGYAYDVEPETVNATLKAITVTLPNGANDGNKTGKDSKPLVLIDMNNLPTETAEKIKQQSKIINK